MKADTSWQSSRHYADASDHALVASGMVTYRQRCAACHGRYLQGQPLWQALDAEAARRAPALDWTGRAWERADEELFEKAKHGRYRDETSPTTASPAFAGLLQDGQILGVVAYVKARWPVGMRVLQAMKNPDHAGMPDAAGSSDWRFPANCKPTS